jgi:hypothetical protein
MDAYTFTAGTDTLMCQGSMTAEAYLLKAIENIDLHLGLGYASAHPELIAAYMQAAALDVIARAIETAGETNE